MPTDDPSRTWAAVDFETACEDSGSACAVGLVRQVGGRRRSRYWLIRPPSRRFVFTGIHGISWQHVAAEKTFAELWSDLAGHLSGVDFIAAHNAPFDRRVMRACCAHAGVTMPAAPWLCTVKLARRAWGVVPTKLPDLARFLRVELDHHDARSDVAVCAQAVARAIGEGKDLDAALV